MAEITSDVYDLYNPSPVSLKQLSVMVVSLEIWRCEINKYRSSNTLKEFRPSGKLISLKTVLIPDLPSRIYPMIDKYVKIFGDSMKGWLWRHHQAVCKFQYDHETCVLEYFEDFVCDYNGAIHYERTAERMMHCDRFDVHQKFLIACTYCFKDDIIRIWPFGLKKTDSLYKRYSENPQFVYWIKFLENDIKITEPPIEECMFDEFMFHNRSSLEYFWNLIPSENRLRKAIDLFIADLPSFVRFILPKLDDQQLNEFLHKNGCELLYALLKNSRYDEEVILSTWIYVKNMMTEIAFTNLIMKMVKSEVRGSCVSSELDQDNYDYDWPDEYCIDNRRDLDSFVQLCFEIWDTAGENLKLSAVRDITSNNRLFEEIYIFSIEYPPISRECKFLLGVLSHATYEQRYAFWHNCWQYLMTKTWVEDLDKIMRLCLRNDDEITQFKKNIMANDGKVIFYCSGLLILTYFDELNQFARFLLPEMHAARKFKQKMLLLALLNDRFGDSCIRIVKKPKEFDEFIKDAYDNDDLRTVFKDMLMSSPSVQRRLSIDALSVPIEQLIEFIDTFVSDERILLEVKNRMIEFLKTDAAGFKGVVPKSSFTSLLSWCLEGNEEVSKFELSYL
ncbi:uncharacterized protein LOC135847224 isoform X1 [Planococcus citri]|uniref:uncharacterized protein LOC135847224 isoform X1 n=1 Tax=Planococcus citri TaxID=170843 RepID=UPI0031FA2EF3